MRQQLFVIVMEAWRWRWHRDGDTYIPRVVRAAKICQTQRIDDECRWHDSRVEPTSIPLNPKIQYRSFLVHLQHLILINITARTVCTTRTHRRVPCSRCHILWMFGILLFSTLRWIICAPIWPPEKFGRAEVFRSIFGSSAILLKRRGKF